MVNAIAHIHIKPPWLPEESFVAGGAAAVAVAGRFLLGIRLRFHNHAPHQLAIGLAFHQQAADELGGDNLSGAGEEGLGEVFGGRGGYGCGLGWGGMGYSSSILSANSCHTKQTPLHWRWVYDS